MISDEQFEQDVYDGYFDADDCGDDCWAPHCDEPFDQVSEDFEMPGEDRFVLHIEDCGLFEG